MALENRFLSNLLLVVSVNLLIKPLYIFGIDRTVQNTVGPEEYGLYFALLNLVYLFQIFNDLGIQNFNHSVYSKFDYLIPKYLPRILGTKFLLSLVFLLIIVLSGLLLGYTGLSVRMILLLAFNQVLASYLIFFRTNLSARGYYSLDSVLSVLDKSIMILVVGYLLWFVPSGDFNIFRFILAQTLSFVLAVTVAIFLLRYYRVVSLRKIRIDWKYSRWILRKSFPYALVLLLMTLYTRMDGVMLERLLTDGREQAGIYAASYRILDAFAMLGLLFAGLLLPMFSKEIAAKSNQIHSLVKVATSIIWAISVAVVASCVAFADPIMQWLYVDADSYYSEVFRWVMGSYVAICLAYIYGTLLTANESMTSMNRIFLAGVILNFILNLLLINAWGAKGAAIATVVTQSFTALALIVRTHKDLKLPVLPGVVGSRFGYLTLVVMITFLVSYLPVEWVWQWLIHAIVCILLAFLTGQLPLQNPIKMVRR